MLSSLLSVPWGDVRVSGAVRGAGWRSAVRPETKGSRAVGGDVVRFERPACRWLTPCRAREEGGGYPDVDAGVGSCGGWWCCKEVCSGASSSVRGDAGGDPMPLKLSLAGSVGCFHMLMVEALLEAVLDGCEDGLWGSILRRVAARGGVVRSVGSATGAVYLKDYDRVEEAPGRFEVAPLLQGVAAQVRGLKAQAGDHKEQRGEVERVASGAVPGAGDGPPDRIQDLRAGVVFVRCSLLDRASFGEAAAAAGRVTCAFVGAFDVAMVDGDAEVECLFLGYSRVGNPGCNVCNAALACPLPGPALSPPEVLLLTRVWRKHAPRLVLLALWACGRL